MIRTITAAILAFGLSFVCAAGSIAQAQEDSSDLQSLREKFEELRADLNSPRTDFDQRYTDELKKLEQKASGSANLDLVLAIRKEAESFKSREPVGGAASEHAELARLQRIYDDQVAKIDKQLAAQLSQLISGYETKLQQLKIELTKSSKIDDALAVKSELERVSALVPKTSPLPTLPHGHNKDAVKGRYVRISIEGPGLVISLAEVEVFSGGRNVARKGEASHSSTNAVGGPAELAIDGNTDGDFYAARSTTHTAKSADPWWEVDLGKEVEISKVVIWNRTDGGLQNRLDGFKLSVLTSKREEVFEKTFPTAPEQEIEIELR